MRRTIIAFLLVCLLFIVWFVIRPFAIYHISSVTICFSNGLVEYSQPRILWPVCEGSEQRMIRLIRKPYPIYIEQPDRDVRIRFKRERVWINEKLQGLVLKNYEDLERNESDLGGIEHLMCHGRLADDRVNQYLAKMTSLKAITILSPMPADLEKIHKYFPSIRALDLNCAYWPCKYDLSLFGKLESISIRGKHWKSLYGMNRSVIRRMSGIYLESATPEDIRDVPEHVSSFELTLTTDSDYLWLHDAKSKLKSCRSLTLNMGTMPVVKLVDLVPKNIDVLTLSLGDDCQNSDYARNMLHEFRQGRPRCLLTTNIHPPDRNAMDCGRWYSYIGEMPPIVSNSSIRMEYLDPKLVPGTAETPIFRGRACKDILRIEKTMRIANPDRIEEIEFPESASREDLIRICKTYRNLKAVSLLGYQIPDDISTVLQNTDSNCIVYTRLYMFLGRFSNQELKRLRVHYDLLLTNDTELTEAEKNAVISLTCTNKSEDISLLTSLPNMRNLRIWVRYPFELCINPASLHLHGFRFFWNDGLQADVVVPDGFSYEEAEQKVVSLKRDLSCIHAKELSPILPYRLAQSIHTILDATSEPPFSEEEFTEFIGDFHGQLSFVDWWDYKKILIPKNGNKKYYEFVYPDDFEYLCEKCDENGDQCIIVRQNASILEMLSNYTWEREADWDVFFNIEPDYYLDYFEDAYIGEDVNAYRY